MSHKSRRQRLPFWKRAEITCRNAGLFLARDGEGTGPRVAWMIYDATSGKHLATWHPHDHRTYIGGFQLPAMMFEEVLDRISNNPSATR